MKKIIMTITLLLAVCSSVFSQQVPIADVAKKVDEHIEAKQYETAYFILTEFLKQNEISGLYYRRAIVQYHRHEIEKSFADFSKAIELLPAGPSAEVVDPELEKQLVIIDHLRIGGSYGACETLLENMINSGHEYSSIYYALANIKQTQMDFEGFFRNFFKAYIINPNSDQSYVGFLTVMLGSLGENVDKDLYVELLIKISNKYFDSPQSWKNIIGSIGGVIKADQEKYTSYRNLFDEDIRPMYDFSYTLNVEQDEEKAAQILTEFLNEHTFKPEENRLMLYYHFTKAVILQDEFISFADTGISEDDIYHKCLFNMYRLKSLTANSDENEVFDCLDKLVTVFTENFKEYDKVAVNKAIANVLNGMATFLYKNEKSDKALEMYLKYMDYFSESVYELLPSLAVHNGRVGDTALYFEHFLNYCRDNEVELIDQNTILSQIIDYAFLADDPDMARKYIQYAVDNGFTDTAEYYKNISAEVSKDNNYRIEKLRGYYQNEKKQIWELGEGGLGPCVKASIWSLFEYYGMPKPYADIDSEVRAKLEGRSDYKKCFEEYLTENGYKVLYILPDVELVKQLIRNNIPVTQSCWLCGNGILTGHINLIYAYDDTVRKLYTLDVSGETRVPYDSLCEAQSLVVIVPEDAELAVNCEKYLTLPQWKLVDDSVIEQYQDQPNMQFYLLWHNGQYCRLQKDFLNAELYLDDAFKIYQPNHGMFYYLMHKTVGSNRPKDGDKILEYISKGLEHQPDSIDLAESKIRLYLSLGLPDPEKADPAELQEYLQLLHKMEKINENYAPIYHQIGIIYILLKQPQEAINALNTYLDKLPSMGPEIIKEQEPYTEQAKYLLKYSTDYFINNLKIKDATTP